MQRRLGFLGEFQHLFERLHRARLPVRPESRVSQMHVPRGAGHFRRDREHPLELVLSGPRRVERHQADAERAAREPAADERGDLIDLFGRRRVGTRGPREMKALVLAANHLHARGGVPGRDAVVDERLAVPVRVPLVDVDRPALGVEHRRDAVHRAILVVQRVFAVRVQLDEPGRDDEAAGVDRSVAAQRTVANRLDAVADDAHVRHAVESALGIHDTAIGDDEVVRSGRVEHAPSDNAQRADRPSTAHQCTRFKRTSAS